MSQDSLIFTRPVQVADVPSGGRRVKITADAAECAALAKTLHLPAIASLTAGFELVPFGRDGISVTGSISARLTQTCVASSEDFESDVAAPVAIRFSTDGVDPNAEVDLADLLETLEAEDPPDLLVDVRIDLAAITAEFLALALDPYPRKPGSEFAAPGQEAEASPFAALAALKKSNP